MEREYIKNPEKIENGAYIRMDIDKWYDDEDNEHKDGVCYGHVKCFTPLKWDNEDEEYYDVLECYETILADGSVTYDDDLGVNVTNIYYYMTDEEKQNFIKKVSKKSQNILNFLNKFLL